MKNLTPALFLLALFFSIHLQAQLSDGFKKLDNKAFDEALDVFNAALSDKDDMIPAQWGIAQILANPDYSSHNYDSAFALKTIIESGLRKYKDSKAKKKWGKKYTLTPDALKEMAKPLAESRWKELNGTRDLQAFDNYLRVFKNRIPAKIRKSLDNQQLAALRTIVTGGAKNYQQVNYLLQRHEKYILDSFPGRFPPLKNDLFKLFMAENGNNLSTLVVFMTQQPKHAISTHLARADFDQAYKEATTSGWIKFLGKYPGTPYDEFIYEKISSDLAKNALPEAQKNQLSQEEKWILEDILQGNATGIRVSPSSVFDGNGKEEWGNYIRRRAGKKEGLTALKSMLKYYMDKREWDASAKLLQDFGVLFPDEAVWVKSTLDLVGGADNGVRPIRLKNNISTKGDEYSPTITSDGQTLVFCASNRKESVWGEDIYISERKDSVWQDAQLLKDISGSGHEAPMCFTADGNTMVVFKNGKVFMSNRNTTGWSPTTPFPVDLSGFGWVADVHFVSGEQRVFFAARTKGSEWDYSSTDIFMAAKDADGNWGKPELLPEPINSAAFDRSPFVHPDQTTMYFSSSREGGLGELDVYKSVRLDNTWRNWSAPVNLGKNINTTGNNWGYVVTTDGSTAYYSARLENSDNEDIFYITLPKEARPQKAVLPIVILVQDEMKKPIPNARVEVLNSNTGVITGENRTSPKAGKVTIYVTEGERVTVSAIQQGYFGDPVSIDSRNVGTEVVITLKTVKEILEGKTSLNADILFDLGKSELKPEAAGQLKFVADFAKREKLKLELSGHTDPTGSDEENLILSKARAEAVRTALIGVGIKPDNMTAVGLGETKLICTEQNNDCYQKNRRVEIRWRKE